MNARHRRWNDRKHTTRSRIECRACCYILINKFKIIKYIITNPLGKTARAGSAFSRQNGVALITAILVVALVSIAAAAILGSTHIALHRTSTLQDSEKAWWYAGGVENWVKAILQHDAEQNQTDSFKDDWAHPVDYLPTDEGSIKGRVEDLQGRFNLNNFGTADAKRYEQYVAYFTRLLENIEGADASQARVIAAGVRDWIDADNQPTGTDGAEDSFYISQNPAYRPPNRPMRSVSEVLAVKGMTADLYDKLMHCQPAKTGAYSCITALPQFPTAINVNTAPLPVLRALTKKPGTEIERFMRERDKAPLEDTAAAFKAPPDGFLTAADDLPADFVTVRSSYFLLHADISVGSGHLALYSFYLRSGQGSPLVLGRSLDTE